MDVLNLQGKITLDTTEYEAAVQRAVTMGGQLAAGLQSAANVGVNQLQTSINNVGQSAGQMGANVNQAADAAQDLGQAAGSANGNVGQLGQGINNADQQSSNFANTIQNAVSVALGNLLTQAISKAKGALIDFAKQSVQVGMSFDSSMSQVAATMGVTADEVQELRDYAKQMGATTAFSATESAQALNYMALAGYDAEKSMEMLPNVLNLAASGAMSLSKASDMVTDAQSALGLSMDETAEMVNKMAMTASKSNTSVEQLGEAMLQIGGTAKKLKGGTTELATILGILADNGMKGAEGGTHLRNMMNSLMSPTKDATDMMDKLGISLYDAEGNMRSLNDVFVDIRTAMSEMATQEERDKVVSTIFNARDMKAAEAMLANVGDRYQELSGYIDQAAGSAQKMADTQLDNLQGDVTLFKSALEGAQITLSEKLEPTLRQVTKVGAQAVSEMSQAFGEHGLKAAIDAAHKAIYDGFGEDTAKQIYKVEAATKAALAAFITYKATVAVTGFFTDAATGAVSLAAGIDKVKNALAGLNVNPIIAIGTAFVAAEVYAASYLDSLAAAIEMPKNAYEYLNDEQKEFVDNANEILKIASESKAEFKETTTNIENQADKYSKLVDELYELDSAEQLSASDKEKMQAIVTTLNSSLEGMNITIDKQTGRLKTNRKEVEKIIAAYKEEAKVAAYKDRLVKLTSDQIDKEEALEEALKKKNEANANVLRTQNELEAAKINLEKELSKEFENAEDYLYNTDKIEAYEEQIEKLNVQLDAETNQYFALDEAWRKLHGEVRNGQKEIDNLAIKLGDSALAAEGNTEAMDDMTEATQKAADTAAKAGKVIYDSTTEQTTFYGTLRGETREWSEETVMKIADVIDQYVEYRSTVEQSIKSSVNLFSEFKRDTSITFSDMMDKVKDNKKGVEDWTLAIQQLRKKGKLDDSIIDQFEEMGVASWGYVRALNHASLEQQEEFSKTWMATQKSIDEAVHQSVKDDKREYDAMLETLTGESGVKLGEYRTMLSEWVVTTADTFVKAMEDAVKAASEGAENLKGGVEDTLNRVDAEGIGKAKGDEFAMAMATEARIALKSQVGNLLTGNTNPTIENGVLSFPTSSVGQAATSENYRNQMLTINLVTPNGDVLAKQTIGTIDFLQGQLAEQRAKGYA